jgi:hypothetical protein
LIGGGCLAKKCCDSHFLVFVGVVGKIEWWGVKISLTIPNTVERLGEWALGRDPRESITFLGQVEDFLCAKHKEIELM